MPAQKDSKSRLTGQNFDRVRKALGATIDGKPTGTVEDVVNMIEINRERLEEYADGMVKIATALGIESADIADVLEKIERLAALESEQKPLAFCCRVHVVLDALDQTR